MKDDEIQPTRISKEEYIKFKQWVQDTHGSVRGHLATEIENALREYRQPEHKNNSIERIEDDIATIKAQLAEGQVDGGTDISQPGAREHADSKPQANAPREKKVEYIISTYYTRDGGCATVGVIKSHIQSEYNFKSGVIDEYVDMIVAELGAKKHPEKNNTFVWGDAINRAKDEIREQAEKEVEEKL